MSNAIKQTLLTEVAKDIQMIQLEDKLTADFYHEACFDCKEATFKVLCWVDETYQPKHVLYPASGFDIVPKLAFGEDRVTHTSLEEKGPNGVLYFPRLGSGKKVIADNANLPFEKESFDIILLLDSPFPFVGKQREELLRVLAKGGVVILSRNLFEEDLTADRLAHYKKRHDLKEIIIPSELQASSLGHIEFFGLQKMYD